MLSKKPQFTIIYSYSMRFFPYVLLAVILLSCGDDDYPVKLDKNQVTRLLTQNNSKIWILTSDIECEEDNTLTFHKAKDAKSSPEFSLLKGEALCDEESAEEETGTWEVISTPSSNQLRFLGMETITYDIVLITATTLHLRSTETELKYVAL